MVKNDNTEQQILDAAEEVFIQKGNDGTRMQEIADKAGINKALLHYYYRSKQKLFETVFKAAFKAFFPRIQAKITSDQSLHEKLTLFVEMYMNVLEKNPYIPAFVIHEINRNPDSIAGLFQELFDDNHHNPKEMFALLDIQIKKEADEGHIRLVDSKHLIISVLSLCIFPYVAKPILTGIMFDGDKQTYKNFLKERKTFVVDFIINSISLK